MLAIITAFPLKPVDQSELRRPFASSTGHAYMTYIYVQWAKADDVNQRKSTVQLYEDGKPLGPAHSDVPDIATKGRGRFIYWTDDTPISSIIFSSSDGTDPNTNGRIYRVLDPNAVDPYVNRQDPATSAN